MPCRINRVRAWTGRLLYETAQWHDKGLPATFATLTYNPEHIPDPPHVSKRELQLFLKRLRAMIHPRKIRYYAVGEYGEQSWRPHYHAIIFGISPVERELVSKCWPYGFVKLGTCERSSIRYVAGYLVKRLTKAKDPRLGGRTPEFACMSLKPAIGSGIVGQIVKSLSTEKGIYAFAEHKWVPTQFQIDGRKYAIPRQQKQEIYKQLGIDRIAIAEYNATTFDIESRSLTKGETLHEKTVKEKARRDQQAIWTQFNRRDTL